MNISFENLSYKVVERNIWGKKDEKEILKSLNGEFRGCEISAIMGPSGSGKSSMLNILSGFTSENIAGIIKVNENIANQKTIRRKSSYIMQENTLHKFITVYETMSFAIKLKVGNKLSLDEQNSKINDILKSLGLIETMTHRVGDLSGGEQKRLTIALELVDDPSILFLDEPTTGLDSSSSTKCIQVLKQLASRGKTIVCTIHSPSALLFELFDNIYALACGSCIYQGSSKNLVQFLKELELVCPEFYSPSDFLLEIATNDYGPQNHRLTEKVKNGSNNNYRRSCLMPVDDDLNLQLPNDAESSQYPTSFYQQFSTLLMRNFLTSYRDKTLTLMRLAVNIVAGLCFGIIFFGIGNEASNIFDVQKYVVYSFYHTMFIAVNSQLSTIPLELPMVRREHFNRWYSSGAYMLALNLVDIPALIFNNIVFVSITYFMTNQPRELLRLGLFFINLLLVGMTSQGLGLMSGSITGIQHTLIIAAGMIFIFTLFSGFFVLMKDTSVGWHWLFYGSFLKHGLDGGYQAIFGFNRTKLDCEADYCHYRWSHKFLETLGVQDNFFEALGVIITSLFLFRIVTYFVIKYRLKH